MVSSMMWRQGLASFSFTTVFVLCGFCWMPRLLQPLFPNSPFPKAPWPFLSLHAPPVPPQSFYILGIFSLIPAARNSFSPPLWLSESFLDLQVWFKLRHRKLPQLSSTPWYLPPLKSSCTFGTTRSFTPHFLWSGPCGGGAHSLVGIYHLW